MSARFQPTTFKALKGWNDDDHYLALQAFSLSAKRMLKSRYKTRGLGVDAKSLEFISQKLLAQEKFVQWTNDRCRQFFEENFKPQKLIAPTRKVAEIEKSSKPANLLTGYFEPVVNASRRQSSEFNIPLYRRPSDLIDINDENRPEGFDPEMRFGKMGESQPEQYFDRAAINDGALNGLGLELAYVKNLVEAFFIHIQGSARLKLDHGEETRITFSAKSGHRYTSLGAVLRKRLDLSLSEMTADRLEEWMYENPQDLKSFLALNQSYIFFEEEKIIDHSSGPTGAAKVPLMAGRSMAVDRTLHTFGTPIWTSSNTSLPEEGKPFSRLMIAHDTGSAIVGPVRGDIFMGSGSQAGFLAGQTQNEVEMTVLQPRVSAG